MKLLKKIIAAIIVFTMVPISGNFPAFAEKQFNAQGFEIVDMIFEDDFEDGILKSNYKLYEGNEGNAHGELNIKNGELEFNWNSTTPAYSVCDIFLDEEGGAYEDGVYFIEMDIKKTSSSSAYLWVSSFVNTMDTSSTDFIRMRMLDGVFFDDKTGNEINAANDAYHHITFMLDLNESKYYTWINGTQYVVNADRAYASEEGINAVRILLNNVAYGGAENYSVFIDNIKIYKSALNDEMAVQRDIADLNFEDLLREAPDDDDITKIKRDLYLPNVSKNGCDISWISSDENVISPGGTVRRGGEDQEVTLTATVSKGAYSFSKNFVFTVLQATEDTKLSFEVKRMVYEDDFNDNKLRDNYVLYSGHEGNDFGELYERSGALELRWNSPSSSYTICDIFLDAGRSVLTEGLYCVELDVKTTSPGMARLWASSNLSTANIGSDDIFRMRIGDNLIYDENNSGGRRLPAPSGHYYHLTLLFDLNEGMYYNWIDGQEYMFRKPKLHTKDGFQALRLFLNGGSGQYSAMVDNLKVYEVETPDFVAIEYDYANLSAQSLLTEEANYLDETLIKANLNLPAVGRHGSKIYWTSSDEGTISADGIVTRPADNMPDRDVVLTATLTHGEITKTKTFDFTVLCNMNNDVRVQRDLDAITTQLLASEDADKIKMSLNFLPGGPYGSEITWESSAPEVINTVGRVTRPRETRPDQNVTVTATFRFDNITMKKEFNFTVLADEVYKDPQVMSDEEFFGVWDKENETFINKGKINYSYSEKLSKTLECVKAGDYDAARIEILEYFRNRQARYTINTSARETLPVNMFCDGWLFAESNFYCGELFADNDFKATAADINPAKVVAGDYSSFQVMAWYNEASYSEIYGIGASDPKLRPKLELLVDGKTRVYEAVDNGVIRAGSYMTQRYPTEGDLLKIRKYGGYLSDEEYSALLKFDLRDLPGDAKIESAKLILTCRSTLKSSEGKRMLVIREPSNTWKGSTVTWSAVGGFIYNNAGLPEGRHWDEWAPYGNTEYMKQASRFRILTATAVEYSITKDEYYPYSALKAVGDIISDYGDFVPTPKHDFGNFQSLDNEVARGQYPRTIDAGGRMTKLVTTFDAFSKSRSMTPDYCSTILKHIWDVAHSLRIRHKIVPDNWQQMEMQGLYTAAYGFPEFYASTGSEGEEENWREYGYTVLENLIVDGYYEDGTYIEPTGDYSENVLRGFAGVLASMERDGYALKPENQELLRNAAYYNVLLRTPTGTSLSYGDATHKEHSGKGETYQAFSKLFKDDELRYIDSFGQYGTEPGWTSRHFPTGRVTFMRSSWSTNALYMFTPVRGHEFNSHGHHDDNQVIVAAYGRILLSDQGKFDYSATPERIWGISTEAHNTVSINDTNQADDIHNGVIHDWVAGGKYDFLSQSSFSNPGYEHRRTILFVKPNYWIVSDNMKPETDGQENLYKQHWHMMPDAKLDGDESNNKIMSNFDNGANIIVASADGEDVKLVLEDGYWSKGYGNAQDTKWGYFEKKVAGSTTLNTVLLPYENGSADVKTEKIPLNVEETIATALKIDTDVNNIKSSARYYLSYENKPGAREFDGYFTDGKMAYISNDKDEKTEILILKDGSYIRREGTTLLSTGSKVSDISVEFQGFNMLINSTNTLDLSELAVTPGRTITNVVINGEKKPFTLSGETIKIGGENVDTDKVISGEGVVAKGGGGAGGGGGAVPTPPAPTPVPTNTPETNKFADILGHWAEDDILNLYNQGIINGRNETHFYPDDVVTRAEAITMLTRALNLKVTEKVISYSDVTEDDWFFEMVNTAFGAGIIAQDINFRPNDAIVREEMVKLLIGCYEMAGGKEPEGASLEFADNDEISDWAKDFISKGVWLNLVKGVDDRHFAPRRNVTRAEASTFILRLLKSLKE